MRLHKSKPGYVICAAIMFFLYSTPLIAQSIWLASDQKSSASLEIIKPSFENYSSEIDTKLLNMVTFLSVINHFQKDIAFVVEIPFANTNIEETYLYYAGRSTRETKSTTAGNPYLGLEIGDRNNHFTGNIGIRLPFTSVKEMDAAAMGIVTDPDRAEAFGMRSAYLIMEARAYLSLSNSNWLRLGAGPSFEIPTEGQNREVESYVHYYAQLLLSTEPLSVITGFSGFMYATASDWELSKMTLHQFGVTIAYNIGRFRPGFHIRVPLDKDLGDALNYAYGINATIHINRQ